MNRRVGALVLLTLGIILVLIGVLSDEWFGARDRNSAASLTIGLREVTLCAGGRCHSESLKHLPVDAPFSMSGNVTFFGGLLAAALAGLAGGLTLTNRAIAGSISPSRLAAAFFLVVLLSSIIFLTTKPDLTLPLHTGMAGPLTMVGSLLGALGALWGQDPGS